MAACDVSVKGRVFVAIRPPSHLITKLHQLQQSIQMHLLNDPIRWVHPDQFHVTLKFMGDVGLPSLGKMETTIQDICREICPFTLKVGRLGCFPNLKKPAVVWVGINGDLDCLNMLKGHVDRALQSYSSHKEQHPFHPHLTLGRVGRPDSRGLHEVGRKVQPMSDVEIGEWKVQQADLIKSDLLPDGAVYTLVASFPLSSQS